MIRNYYLSNKKTVFFKNPQRMANAYNLRARCGVFSQEEAEYCNRLREQLINNSDKSAVNSFQTVLFNINSLVSKTLANTVQKGCFLYYKCGEKITSKLLKQIQLESFKNLVLNNAESQNKVICLPYINTEQKETAPKITPFGMKDSFFLHPERKVCDIIKANDIDTGMCEKYAKIMSKEPLAKIISQKIHLLQEMNEFLNRADDSYDFVFSKEELRTIKLLANKYNAIEHLLANNGINTKSIEALMFTKINTPLKTGDKLPNDDIVLKTVQIYDKQKKSDTDALITFANTDRGYRFKIYRYDKALFEKTPQITKLFQQYVKTSNIKGINCLNSKVAKSIRDNEIAEVFIEQQTRKQMIEQMKKAGTLSEDIIDNVTKEDDTYYYVKNLQNFNPKKYQNVATPLIGCLKEFGINNNVHKGFFEALAFGNVKHSPVFLYLRAGCIPISHSTEELEKFIPDGFDFKKSVWFMYKIKK